MCVCVCVFEREAMTLRQTDRSLGSNLIESQSYWGRGGGEEVGRDKETEGQYTEGKEDRR